MSEIHLSRVDLPKPIEIQKQDKATLHIGNGMEPANLDPTKVMGISEINILSNLFEGLTIPHPVTWAPSPGVALSWTISSSQTVYTFHLHPSALWSN